MTGGAGIKNIGHNIVRGCVRYRKRRTGRSLCRTPGFISENLEEFFNQGIRTVGITTLGPTNMVQEEALHDLYFIGIHVNGPVEWSGWATKTSTASRAASSSEIRTF